MNESNRITIKNLPKVERPREKFLQKGINALTDEELLAILLRVGIHGKSAIDIAKSLLENFGGFKGLAEKDIFELSQTKGVSIAKVAQIKAAIEIGKRLYFKERAKQFVGANLDVSNEIVFDQLLLDLRRNINQLKEDVEHKFDALLSEKEANENIDLTEFLKDYNAWEKIEGSSKEKFCIETIYVLLNRVLIIRIFEDKGVIPNDISSRILESLLKANGSERNYKQMIKRYYTTMNAIYPHLFVTTIFDWYIPERRLYFDLLSTFSKFNFRNVDRDILGKLYEQYIPKEERKRLGQFYTPEEVINYILNSVGYRADANIEGKLLLDPACGSGGFLVRAVKILIEKLKKAGSDAETILDKARENIYGFDINPFACHLAETNLLFQVIELAVEAKRNNPDFRLKRFHIYETDSLEIPEEPSQQILWSNASLDQEGEIIEQIKSRKGKFKEGFDFIIGNPPYAKRRSLSAAQKRYFSESIYGHVNYYGLFLHLGVNLLKDKGHIGFIIPQSMTSGLYYKNLRKFLFNHAKISDIATFTSRRNVFDDVLQGVMIFVASKEKDDRPYLLQIREVSNKRELILLPKSRCRIRSDNVFIKRDDNVLFFLSPNKKAYSILEKIQTLGLPLSSQQIGYKAKTGTIVWNRLKELLINESEEGSAPLIWANNVKRFRFEFTGDNHHKNAWLRVTSRTKPLLTKGVNILVQRTTASEQPRRMIAALPSEFLERLSSGYFVENHINFITREAQETEILPEYLLALLNSSLFDYIFRQLNGNTQVSASELNLLPINPIADQLPVVNLVKQMSDLIRQNDERKVEEKERELDEMIFDIYDLEESERQLIRNFYSQD